MKVLISGSSGLIGTALVRSLESSGHSVTRLVRPSSAGGSNGIEWDPASGSLDARRLEGLDAAIHLSGENVASGRWSAEQKARIRDSRVKSTELLANALAGLDSPPRVFACASATGYYGDRGDEILAEDAAPGSDFLADVSVEWENATAPASEAGIRVANMRISVVLTAAGGMVATVGPIFRLGIGGRLGSGRQYLSWISRQDIIRAMEWILEHDDLSGPVNLCSPNPGTNTEFTRTMGSLLRRPTLFPVPRFALRITQGEITDMLLASVRTTPGKLSASGFEFRHPNLEDALRWALTDRGV
jgi:uncharacterized protein (TIGR01777 family)